jgi:probable F420-dependent oxidoreductase
VKIGIIYPQTELNGDPAAVRDIGLATEAAGYDHLLTYDHVLGTPQDSDAKVSAPYTDKHPFHDPFVMFAYLAAITQRIELVAGVVILPQRQTALVARQAADLDLLSGERFRLGVGIGWNQVEYDALGQDFTTRGKRVGEQVELLRKFWKEPLVTFNGQFDQVTRAAINPRPKRMIPVWMGGFAEVALRRAARLADGFIFADGIADSVALVPQLREFLTAEGRDQASFGLHCNMLFAKDPAAVIERASQWRDIGGTHASVVTMALGFTTCGEHIAYIQRVAEALDKAGLLTA